MSYRYDTRHFSPQAQAVIRNRDESDRLLREDSQSKSVSDEIPVYPVSLFMRLGREPISKYDGKETIKTYEDLLKQKNAVYFSTDSLANGMSRARVSEFLNAISKGYRVEIIFVIGHAGGGDNNKIERIADVLDVQSCGGGMSSPDISLTPTEWQNARKNIWIKIRNLRPSELTTDDYIIDSKPDHILTGSIINSEYHFGYVRRIYSK